jgi:DNA-binding response OmpR family regulator
VDGLATGQRGRVLVVDDNAMNVDVLRRILRKEYDLEIAASGDECLAKLPAFKPQMVLLDVMMPGMDGYETCRRIKSSPWGDSIHVILVSGRGTADDRTNGYEAQADDYVVKPFDHAEVLNKVRDHFHLLSLQIESGKCWAHEALVQQLAGKSAP